MNIQIHKYRNDENRFTYLFVCILFYFIFCIQLNAQFSIVHTMNGGLGEGYIPQGTLAFDGTYLYGTNSNDFTVNAAGTVFKVKPDGTGFQVLHQFNGTTDGKTPLGGLVYNAGVLYGTARTGGSNNNGVIYKINTDGTGFTVIFNFTSATTGNQPTSGMILIGNTLFGSTYDGGANNGGVVFKVKTDGSNFTILHDMGNWPSDGAALNPIIINGDKIYGTATVGGTNFTNGGLIYTLDTNGNVYTILRDFVNGNPLGIYPSFPLKLIGTKLYGMTTEGLTNNLGGLFSINTDGTSPTTIMEFGGSNFQIINIIEYNGVLIATVINTPYGQLYNNLVSFYWLNTDATNQNLLHDFNPGGLIAAPTIPSGDPIVINGAIYGVAHHGGDIGGIVYKHILPTVPILSTNSASSIAYYSAESGANVTSDGYGTVTSRGLVWSTSQNPTIDSYSGISSNGTGIGAYNQSLTNLNSNTTYYIRAYATNFVGTGYGSQTTFTTLPNSEDLCPNNGDGNDDGILDSQQDYVHSMYNPNTQKYITIVSLDSYEILNPSVQVPNDSLYYYPAGLIKFTIAQSQANIKIIYHDVQTIDGYRFRKLNSSDVYFFLPNAVLAIDTIAGKSTATVRFILTDGARGDYDGIVNGSITDPGGPAILAINANIPTLSEWARILLVILLLSLGAWKAKKYT